ncbi:class I SAM-dependent methyltransferase [Thermosynechococcaceae cyanobacterium BACA0444]|uniref:Class I SAM-dependent methyltransferase n=1 Tax=Pseudocalidococcus azoricus BACA0444 TaxID=2918990 RepID=A0AAE4FTX3_9CYAN|nr:class I SAM-dependent methyltransferase [Pseudocalidococcus azoricus]MDS3862309.1 class I SAM-dependent methyltransferase [Pseudocalidococcus azoricus BACA0444]
MGKRVYYSNIAHIYDQTRWLPEPIAEDVADFILTLVNATPETTFLEPGVGTGLNVLPFVKRGYSVTGIDVSPEMLNQFRQKLDQIPPNLKLILGDASQLPFPDRSFDVVLTVHMLHAFSNLGLFLDEIDRVLKPNGFYLNAQWITPPARLEFEQHLQTILAKYQEPQPSRQPPRIINEINVEEYLSLKGYQCNYLIAKEWKVRNQIQELLSFYRLRAYGLCWLVPEEAFWQAMDEFELFCHDHYGSLEVDLSSQAKFEIWAYTAS